MSHRGLTPEEAAVKIRLPYPINSPDVTGQTGNAGFRLYRDLTVVPVTELVETTKKTPVLNIGRLTGVSKGRLYLYIRYRSDGINTLNMNVYWTAWGADILIYSASTTSSIYQLAIIDAGILKSSSYRWIDTDVLIKIRAWVNAGIGEIEEFSAVLYNDVEITGWQRYVEGTVTGVAGIAVTRDLVATTFGWSMKPTRIEIQTDANVVSAQLVADVRIGWTGEIGETIGGNASLAMARPDKLGDNFWVLKNLAVNINSAVVGGGIVTYKIWYEYFSVII